MTHTYHIYVKPETISTPHHVLVLASVGHTIDVCTKDALHDGIDTINISVGEELLQLLFNNF